MVVVDNLATGYRQNLNRVQDSMKRPSWIRSLGEIFQREQPDIVNHHAAQNDDPPIQRRAGFLIAHAQLSSRLNPSYSVLH